MQEELIYPLLITGPRIKSLGEAEGTEMVAEEEEILQWSHCLLRPLSRCAEMSWPINVSLRFAMHRQALQVISCLHKRIRLDLVQIHHTLHQPLDLHPSPSPKAMHPQQTLKPLNNELDKSHTMHSSLVPLSSWATMPQSCQHSRPPYLPISKVP